jgi:hypothetical protein
VLAPHMLTTISKIILWRRFPILSMIQLHRRSVSASITDPSIPTGQTAQCEVTYLPTEWVHSCPPTHLLVLKTASL